MENKNCVYDLIKENIYAALLLRKNGCLKKVLPVHIILCS